MLIINNNLINIMIREVILLMILYNKTKYDSYLIQFEKKIFEKNIMQIQKVYILWKMFDFDKNKYYY
jgi:hypothetical protein